MKKLHENQNNELTITMKGKEIIVETKQDVIDRQIRKNQREFLIESIIFILSGIALGMCVTYLILN
jgi:hypothetical protein